MVATSAHLAGRRWAEPEMTQGVRATEGAPPNKSPLPAKENTSLLSWQGRRGADEFGRTFSRAERGRGAAFRTPDGGEVEGEAAGFPFPPSQAALIGARVLGRVSRARLQPDWVPPLTTKAGANKLVCHGAPVAAGSSPSPTRRNSPSSPFPSPQDAPLCSPSPSPRPSP